jgi:hypothetical protein
MRAVLVAIVALGLCAPSDALADDTVVLAPLATLGAEAKSKETRSIEKSLVAGLEAPGFSVKSGKPVLKAIKKARKAKLRTCDGDAKCLAELGKLMNVDYVVFGEIGGLGDVRVIYLKVVDTKTKKELRSTTLEVGGAKALAAEAKAAGFRLLVPDRYNGNLVLKVDTDKAAIYVDGEKVAKSPTGPIEMSVGTHAIRVNHPEFRDFVRFVDIGFDADTTVEVNLHQFPIVSSDMIGSGGTGTPDTVGGGIIDGGIQPTPWYRTWWATAAFAGGIVITSAIIVGLIADGIDADREKTVGDGRPMDDSQSAPGIPLISW